MSPEELIVKLEAELEAGWPEPWWPQDDPRVRTQRLPERCKHGHDLAESTVRWKRSSDGGLMRWDCRTCHNLANTGRLPQAA